MPDAGRARSEYVAERGRGLRRFRRNAADPALAGQLAAYLTRHAPAFAECARPAYCHGDVHKANLLAELGGDGTCSLTGLLDPENMHADDPLMDFMLVVPPEGGYRAVQVFDRPPLGHNRDGTSARPNRKRHATSG